MRVAVGRADLVRLVADLSPERVGRAAALLGFEAPLERDEVPIEFDGPMLSLNETSAARDELPAPFVMSGGKSLDAPRIGAPEAASLPFWRLETIAFTDEPEPSYVPRSQSTGLTEDDLRSPGHSAFATPLAPPLAPWSRLWPVLRAALMTSILGRDPDVPALVRALCRGEIVRRIPRVTRHAWSGRASVWVDRSPRLVPFWADQGDVCRRLRKTCGQSGLDVRLLDSRTQAISMARRRDLLAGFRPDPMTPVLVLGDIGVHGSFVERSTWLRTANHLHRAGVRVTALVPSPPSRWEPAVARAWNAVHWERGQQRGEMAVHDEPRFWQERAERLLRLAAPAALMQPGLLRTLRRLLPASQTDAGTEVDVWSHSDVRAADATGLVLHPEAAERWRSQFAKDVATDLKVRVSGAINHWHLGLPKELLRAETLTWHALVPSEIAPPGDLADALAFAGRLEETERWGELEPSQAASVHRYERVLLSSMPDSVYTAVPTLKIVWAAAFQDERSIPVPPGIDPRTLYAELGAASGYPRVWSVRQVGNHLMFSRLANGEWPSHPTNPGSPIAWLLAAQPYLWITHARGGIRTQHHLDKTLSIPLHARADLELRTDRCEMLVNLWRRETWAVAAGRDHFGLWADAEVKGILQRFRWIPPGRFQMGGPKDDARHFTSEQLQQTVTWTNGRWLADTPVTSAFWGAVMNDPNPSTRLDRPVEDVSWSDFEEFLARLDELTPGLCARLPSEAEWEYAYRAGLDSAKWFSPPESRGAQVGPHVDSIARDDRNSRYRSQAAGRNAPNPFGLYDMLGAVDEWCQLDAGPPDSTSIDTTMVRGANSESLRIIRGGFGSRRTGYISTPRFFANATENTNVAVGFRLARNATHDTGTMR